MVIILLTEQQLLGREGNVCVEGGGGERTSKPTAVEVSLMPANLLVSLSLPPPDELDQPRAKVAVPAYTKQKVSLFKTPKRVLKVYRSKAPNKYQMKT